MGIVAVFFIAVDCFLHLRNKKCVIAVKGEKTEEA